MRSKATNILQTAVLFSGIVYIAIGLLFFISPLLFGRIFSIQLTDDWFKGIQYDTFLAPLFFLSRGFAAMLFSVGLSMVLPLYDPLKYRGLIYFTGIIFPVTSSSLLLYYGIDLDYWIITSTGLVFLAILAVTTFGLIITKTEADSGTE